MPEMRITALVSYHHWAKNDRGTALNQNAGAKLKRRRFSCEDGVILIVGYLLRRHGNLTKTINAR
jgi:hypothetical protein